MNHRTETKQTFDGYQEIKLTYRSWQPKDNGGSKKALIILHRGHEHSGRVRDIVDNVCPDEFWAFSFDSRGHGESPGPRGYAPSFTHLVKDLDLFVKFVSETYKIKTQDMLVVANSVGAVIASTWAHDYAPDIKGMILAAPAFNIKLYVPLALPALKIFNYFKKDAFISSYVKPKFLTHDKEQQRLYNEDKLITPQIAVNILLDLYQVSERVVSDASAIHIPTLILSAEKDYVVNNFEQELFYKRLSSTKKRFVTLPNFYHGVLYEENRQKAFKECSEFINDCYNYQQKSVSLKDAHRDGFTLQEYEEILHTHMPIYKEFFYWVQRASLFTIGWMSKGIRIGLKHGFDSGLSLDHVYQNRPEGFTPIGKLIDYFYINSVGWKGIRKRKTNLQNSLDIIISKLKNEGKPIRILDIASGPARYLIETAKKEERTDLKVIVRDYDINNIKKAKKLAAELSCTNIEFAIADAFDHTTYENLHFSPNIIVISGLFELFPDNDMIRNSLKGLHKIMADRAYVVYTGQPWHPQLEMIAQTLNNREGKKWIMRRRSQKELDDIFKDFGICKTDMDIDNWGIFTVSTATYSKSQIEFKEAC